MRAGWLTPDSLPSDMRVCTLSFPDSEDFHSLVRGALFLLSQPENYEQFGTLTPEQVSDAFRDMLFSFLEDDCMQLPVGSIMLFSGDTEPDNCLFCRGQTLTESGYPELFPIIGTTYGMGGTGTFKLPNLKGRVPVGVDVSGDASYDVLGETGGEKNHTLVASEVPSNLTYYYPTGGAVTSHAMQFTTTGLLTSGFINPSGGAAHNNLQPYIALNYIIRYR